MRISLGCLQVMNQSRPTKISQGFALICVLILCFTWIDKTLAALTDARQLKHQILLTQKDERDVNKLLIGVWESQFTSQLGPVEIKYLFRRDNVFLLTVTGITSFTISGEYELVNDCIRFSNQINPENGNPVSVQENFCIEWIDDRQFKSQEGVIYKKKTDY
jgi:hypothetical protein